jgi:hypothetical protein
MSREMFERWIASVRRDHDHGVHSRCGITLPFPCTVRLAHLPVAVHAEPTPYEKFGGIR